MAVLLHEGPNARGCRPARAAERGTATGARRSPRHGREFARSFGRSGKRPGGDLTCEIEEQASALHVELRGDGCKALYGKDADGEPLRALEHLLLRMYGEAIRPQALRLRCEGFREIREAALGERARRLAEQVRETGEPSLLEPMNAYERRLVHVALQEEPGVRTTSIGEGSARRVQIVSAAARDATAEAQDRASEGSDAH